MRQKIISLGGGMVGSAIARDLQESGYLVTVADRDKTLAEKLVPFDIDFIKLDFADLNAVRNAVLDYDLVVGAVPGFMGYNVLKTVIEAGINIVDISFMPEDSRQLDALAKSNGVTVLADAGVAPGLSNLIFGKELAGFDKLESAKCFVGGLPQNPQPPWFYKSVFSPIDVIEEYTRPARLVENGTVVTRPAMTEIEAVQFDKVGPLDAFNSDGLRSLLELPIPNMVEKTLRYPGHIQKILKLRDGGMFTAEKIKETAEALFNDWTPKKGDFDQTIMRLEFQGMINGKNSSKTYDLIDYYDEEKNISSMARTTGYTCTAAVNILLNKEFDRNGVYNLESIGNRQYLVEGIMIHLREREIYFTINNFV